MLLDDLLHAGTLPDKIILSQAEIEKLIYKYKGLKKDFEREKAFWESTNKNLVIAYKSLDKKDQEIKKALSEINILNELDTILQKTPDIIFKLDAEDRFVFINDAIKKYGYDPRKIIGKHILDIFHPYEADKIRRQFNNRETVNDIYHEFEVRMLSGSDKTKSYTFWVSTEALYMDKIPSREIYIGLQGIARDITEKKAYETQLARSISLLKATFESTADGILVVDKKGRWSDFNQKFVDIWNIPSLLLEPGKDKEALRYVISTIIDPEKFLDKVREPFNDANIHSFDMVELKNGKVLECYTHPQSIGDKIVGRVWSFRDITERLQIENELRVRDEKLSNFASQTEQLSLAAASIISIKDEQQVFNKISKAIVDFSDYRRVVISLFKEKPPFRDIIAFGGVERERVDQLRNVEMPRKWYNKVFVEENNIGQYSYYIPHTKKNILNQEATVYGSGSVPESKNKWHPEDNLFVRMNDEKGKTIGVISVDESKSGLRPSPETVRPLEIFASLISQIVILKKGQEERRKIEERLRQTQKLEAIGTLAGGIAHDFNNILSGILGYSELIQEDLETLDCRPVTSKRMRRIINASLRAKDVVSQILDFSRSRQKDPIVVSVILIVKEVLQLLRASLPSSIKIEQVLVSKSCVMADPTSIYQILMNLCTNAKDAMYENGGTLSLHLKNINLDKENLTGHEGVSPGHFLLISVTDTGCGMEKEVIARILEPFYTTKINGEGSGMGLSVVHGIVKSLEGLMKISSSPGQGSTFEVFLPIHEKNIRFNHQILTQIKNCKGDEKILVIDNEETLAEMTKDFLEYFGYKATFFSSSKKALEHFKENLETYDLIISDITMPDITGDILVKQIRLILPDIPVILCTGYNEFIDEKILDAFQINAILYKPVPAKDLMITIRRVLNGENDGKHTDH